MSHLAGCWPTVQHWWTATAPAACDAGDAAWVALVVVYTLAMALPFVPAIAWPWP